MSGRTIVVGDIHGCYDELVALLDKAAFGADDRVVAVGDLIVKGLKNREVLDLFIEDERFSAVLGNHDRALRRYFSGDEITLKESQEKVRRELEVDVARYSAYLKQLPLMIDLGSHVVVHAGLRPHVALAEQEVEDLTELRTLGPDRTNRDGAPWYEHYDDDKIVLFGHWPAPAPRRGPRAIGLDTGCVYGFQLTAYVIETGEWLSVDALRAYEPPKRSLA
jgi:predicted phosphodiesterase